MELSLFEDIPLFGATMKDLESEGSISLDVNEFQLFGDEYRGDLSLISDQSAGLHLWNEADFSNMNDQRMDETPLDTNHDNQVFQHPVEEGSYLLNSNVNDQSMEETSLDVSHINQISQNSLENKVTSVAQQLRKIKEEKIDSSNKYYFCSFFSCSYKSTRRDKLDKHMEKHVLIDGVHPNGKRRKRTDTLPQRYKHNAEEYKCLECPYSCTVYEAWKNHESFHASGNTNLTFLLSCKICGEDYPSQKEMKKHMKKHKKGERFCCDICNWDSAQLKKIIQHRRIHTGEKPHLCPHCNYRTSRRDNLRSHIRRMHNKENMYIDTFNPD